MTVSSWNLAHRGWMPTHYWSNNELRKTQDFTFFSKWLKQMSSRSSAPSSHCQTIRLWLCFCPVEWVLLETVSRRRNKSIKCGHSKLWWLTSFPFIFSRPLSPSAVHLTTSSISLPLLLTCTYFYRSLSEFWVFCLLTLSDATVLQLWPAKCFKWHRLLVVCSYSLKPLWPEEGLGGLGLKFCCCSPLSSTPPPTL